MYLFYYSFVCVKRCKDDSQCENKEVCLESGECSKGCRNDNHCEQGSKCFQNECHSVCQSNSACGLKKYCHIDHKVCLDSCDPKSPGPTAPCGPDYKCISSLVQVSGDIYLPKSWVISYFF